jgi:hypothetical protein
MSRRAVLIGGTGQIGRVARARWRTTAGRW